MTDKSQQIFLVEYNGKTQFKEPDNLSNQSQEQTRQKRDKEVNDSQEDGSSLVDQFDQTPIHKYGSRPVCMQTPQGSQKQDQQKGELQRNKMILEFKVTQLQKICNTLTSANSKLLDKIEQLQQQNDRQKSRIVQLQRQVQVHESRVEHNYYGGERQSSEQNNSRIMNGMDESVENGSSSIVINGNQSLQQQHQLEQQIQKEQQQLQQQVSDIEKMIKQYRQQLKKSQQVNRNNKLFYQTKMKQMDQTIQGLNVQIETVNQLNFQLEERLHQLDERNTMLEHQLSQLKAAQLSMKNNNFLLKEDTGRTQSQSSYYQTPMNNVKHSPSHYTNNMMYNNNQQDYLSSQSFSSTLQLQLQKLIDKLVKQLQTQRTTKAKISLQLKRVQSQLLSSQKLIIHKNQQIHMLEMQLLQYQKNTLLMKSKHITPANVNVVGDSSNSNRNMMNSNRNIMSNNSSIVYNNNSNLYSSPSKNNKQLINKSDYFTNKQSEHFSNKQSQHLSTKQSDYFSTKQSVTTQRSPITSSSINKNYGTPQYQDNNNNNKYLRTKQQQQVNKDQQQVNKDQQQQQLQQQTPQQPNNNNQSLTKNINIITNTITTSSLNRQSSQHSLNRQSSQQQSLHKNQQQSPLYLTRQSPVSPKSNNEPGQKKLLQTFSLMQLLNDSTMNLSSRQKLYIGLKLVQFYQQKIYTQNNYQLLSLENVLVTNFNKINLRLIKIRTNQTFINNLSKQQQNTNNNNTYQYQDIADTLQKLIENLAFLLNSLFIDVPNSQQEHQFGQSSSQRLLKQKIQAVLEQHNVNQSTLGELKYLIESALNESINQAQSSR